MKDKEIVNASHAGFVHSKKQTKFVLHQVYSIYSWQSLLALTNHWLYKMPQPVIMEFETLARNIGDSPNWELGYEDKPFTDERELNRQKRRFSSSCFSTTIRAGYWCAKTFLKRRPLAGSSRNSGSPTEYWST